MASRRVSPDFQRFPAELIQIVSSPDMRHKPSRHMRRTLLAAFVLNAIAVAESAP